jgi:signal transduction histidine kinase
LNSAPNSDPAHSSDRLAPGSGLENLKKRLAAVGGKCTVESGPGQGTRVTMAVRLKFGSSPIMVIGDEIRAD